MSTRTMSPDVSAPLRVAPPRRVAMSGQGDPPRTHYDILGVDPTTSTTEDIKHAYRQKARVDPYHPPVPPALRRPNCSAPSPRPTHPRPSQALTTHPDKNKGEDEEFVRVKRAWEVLSDPDERKKYDAQLASRRVEVVIDEHLDLNDLQSEEGYFTEDELDMNYTPPQLGRRLTCRYWHPCRCGGGFEVMADELHQDFDHVDLPCFNCSLHVRVTYGCE